MKQSNYTPSELEKLEKRDQKQKSLRLSSHDVYVSFEGDDVCLDGYFTKDDLLKIIAAMEPAK